MTPILSIFIPTYNRANYLKIALDSLVCQFEFLNSDKVEIVISDNASEDNTQDVCQEFVQRFPNKIIYNRNNENIGAESNFLKLFDLTNGQFVKFSNDTVNFKENALKEILNFIEENLEEKPVLLFLNKGKNKEYLVKSPDDLLKKMSYNLTWIGTIGFWKSDFVDVKEFFGLYNQVPHVNAIYSIVDKKRNCKILAKSLFEVQLINNKGGYNIVKVFGINYLSILNEYKKKREIGLLSYEIEKILLLKHINFLQFEVKDKNRFEKDGYFKYILSHYWYNPYFYLFYLYVQGFKFSQNKRH